MSCVTSMGSLQPPKVSLTLVLSLSRSSNRMSSTRDPPGALPPAPGGVNGRGGAAGASPGSPVASRGDGPSERRHLGDPGADDRAPLPPAEPRPALLAPLPRPARV